MTRIHLILIGNELLSGKRQDLHLKKIASDLASRGASVTSCEIIRDHPEEVAEAVGRHLKPNCLILTTGGLGPTLDDLTREAIAETTDVPLREETSLWESLCERFRQAGREISRSNKSQILVPCHGTFFPNRNGTAPGLVFEPPQIENCRVIALPGPPRELNPMWEEQVLPFLAEKYEWGAPPIEVLMRFAMMGESNIDETMRPILQRHPEVEFSSLIRVSRVDVTLRLPATFPDGKVLLRETAHRTIAEFPDFVYEYVERFDADGARPREIEEVIRGLLEGRGEKAAVAESCTGGLLAKYLTDYSGSSRVFLGGVVSYANEVKEQLLGVSRKTLERYGAVSEETAREMLDGLFDCTGADWGISITGVAGPEGGTETKPVGLVFIGIGNREEREVVRYRFPGDRSMIRERTVVAAQRLLWLRLRGEEPIWSIKNRC